MSNQPDPDGLRPQIHATWNAVAGGWAQNIDHIEERGAGVTVVMLSGLSLGPGDRILELACGTGAVGLSAAREVGAGGMVTLSDVAPDMAAIAAERATELGLTNVATAVLDIEQIEMPDETYDAVLCREGLMFAVDPARALGEVRRVLKPAGRVSVAVWAERDRNPWLGVLFDAVSAELGFAVPPPGIPGPFSLSEPGRLRELFDDAGFLDIDVVEVDNPLRARDFDSWWARVSAMAGPLAKVLESLPPETIGSLITRLRGLVGPYGDGAGLDLPGVTMVVTARRG